MREEVEAADLRLLNKNDGFAHVFGRIADLSEEGRAKVAEALWSEGRRRTDSMGLELLRSAASARKDLCSDVKDNRKRVLEMRQEIVTVGQGDGQEQSDKALLRLANLDKRMLATVLMEHNRFDDALAMYEKALDFHLQHGNDEDIASTYNGIGNVLSGLGRFQESIQIFKQCLEIRQRLYGETHIDVARIYHNIGCSYRKVNLFIEALECHEHDRRITSTLLGEDHYDTSRAHEAIGQVYNDLGRNENALKAHYKCLEVRIARFGMDNLNVATSFCNVARSLKNLRRLVMH